MTPAAPPKGPHKTPKPLPVVDKILFREPVYDLRSPIDGAFSYTSFYDRKDFPPGALQYENGVATVRLAGRTALYGPSVLRTVVLVEDA